MVILGFFFAEAFRSSADSFYALFQEHLPWGRAANGHEKTLTRGNRLRAIVISIIVFHDREEVTVKLYYEKQEFIQKLRAGILDVTMGVKAPACRLTVYVSDIVF